MAVTPRSRRRRRAVAGAWTSVAVLGASALAGVGAGGGSDRAVAGVEAVPGQTVFVSPDADLVPEGGSGDPPAVDPIHGGAVGMDLSANGETLVYEVRIDGTAPVLKSFPAQAGGRAKSVAQADPLDDFDPSDALVVLVRTDLEGAPTGPPVVVSELADLDADGADERRPYNGRDPAVDDRGELVVFTTTANPPSFEDPPVPSRAVYVRDLRDPARPPILLSFTPSLLGNLRSAGLHPTISGDGTTVAYVDDLDRLVVVDLDPDDDGTPLDDDDGATPLPPFPFLPDDEFPESRVVELGSAAGNDAVGFPQLDGDGDRVVLELVPTDPTAQRRIAIVDLDDGDATTIVTGPAGTAGPPLLVTDGHSLLPTVDRAGEVIAFVSFATPRADAGPPPAELASFPAGFAVRLGVAGAPPTVIRLGSLGAGDLGSLDPDDQAFRPVSHRPDVSPDGVAVAYTTTDSQASPPDDDDNGLGPDDQDDSDGSIELPPPTIDDVYVTHLTDGRTERASLRNGSAQLERPSDHSLVSDGARTVGFSTDDPDVTTDPPSGEPSCPSAFDSCDGTDAFLRQRPAALDFDPDPADFGVVPVGMASPPIFVEVSNTGTAFVDLRTPFAPDPDDPPGTFQILSTEPDDPLSCAVRLAPGAACSLPVTFTPSAVGPFAASIRATINDVLFHATPPDDREVQGFQVLGQGGTSRLIATPSPLDLGTHKVGAPRTSDTIIVENVADDPDDPGLPITLGAIELVDEPGATDFRIEPTGSCDPGDELLLGQTCTIDVSFSPQAVGLRTAEVSIANDATETPDPLLAPVLGRGRLGTLTLAPSPVDFPTTKVGDSAGPVPLQLTNTGSEVVVVDAIELTGSHPGDFDLVDDDDCLGSLAVGASCEFRATFRPSATGARSAVVVVTSDAQNDPVTGLLRGTGARGAIVLTPDPRGFDDAEVGVAAPTESIQVNNVGSAAVDLAAFQIGGAHPADFQIADDTGCPTTLAAGASCLVVLRFTPSGSGPRNGTFTVLHDGDPTPTSATLQGRGLQGALVLQPVLVTFGAHLFDTPTPPERDVVAVSIGDFPVVVGPASIAGVDPDHYAVLDPNQCVGAVLPPQATCTFVVRFQPRFAGTRSARLVVDHDGVNRPATAELLGDVIPRLRVTPGLGPPGSVPTAEGLGWAPGSTVTVRWVDHAGSTTAVPDGNGLFAVPMPVFRRAHLGDRQMEATAAGVVPVQLDTPFLVVPATFNPPGLILRD